MNISNVILQFFDGQKFGQTQRTFLLIGNITQNVLFLSVDTKTDKVTGVPRIVRIRGQMGTDYLKIAQTQSF